MKYFDYLLETPTYDRPEKHRTVMPRIFCNDGESVSVQAGEYLYCSPRNNHGRWHAIEAGYPSVPPPRSWLKYAEEIMSLSKRWSRLRYHILDFKKAKKYGLDVYYRAVRRAWHSFWARQGTDTIYPYMPVERVYEFIEAHGGEATEKCFAELGDDRS